MRTKYASEGFSYERGGGATTERRDEGGGHEKQHGGLGT